MKTLFKEKKLIISITIIFLLAGAALHFTADRSGYTSISVLLKFENIHQGLYPDNTAFDKDDLIDEDVLSSALNTVEVTNGALSASILRPHLEVEAIIPEELRQSNGEAVEAFHSSNYRINLYNGERLGLSRQEQFQILNAVVDQYEEEYQIHLGMAYPLVEISEEEILDNDYPFIPNLLEEEIENLRRHVQMLQSRDQSFRSEEVGYSFSDIIYNLDNLADIKISSINSFIRENNLTNDSDATLRRYQSIIQELERDIARKDEQSTYSRDLLSQVEEGDLDVTDERELPQDIIENLLRHEYYPGLLQRSLDARIEVDSMEVDLAYYQNIITRLQEEGPEGDEAQALREEADEDIKNIKRYRLLQKCCGRYAP